MIEALQATCRQQGVRVDPQAEVFTSLDAPLDAGQEARWKTFLSGNWLDAPDFPTVVQVFRRFYLPVVDGTAAGHIWRHPEQQWSVVTQEPEKR